MKRTGLLTTAAGWLVLLAGFSAIHAGGKADNAEARELLGRAIKSLGGEAKLAKFRALTWKGKLNVEEGGLQIAVKLNGSSLGWDRHRIEVEMQFNGMNQNVLLVVNGDKGWAKVGEKVEPAPAEAMRIVRDVLFVVRLPQSLPELKDKKLGLSHLGEVKIGDRDGVGLRITRKGSPDVNFYFDKKKHLPIKSEFRFTHPQGKEMELEVQYSDYREIAGCQISQGMTFKVGGKEIRMDLSDIQPQESLEANLFARPE